MKLFFPIVFLSICLFSGMVRADVSVRLNPEIVYVGESAQLSFASDAPFDAAPDLSALIPNFIVQGPATQTFQSLVNGKRTVRYELVYAIFPQKAGKFVLDALTYRGQKLPPVTLEVGQAPAGETAPVPEFTATVSDETVYPGQSFVYTVEAIVPDNATQIDIVPPVVSGGDVTLLQADSQRLILKNNRRMLALTRRFLITPESAGALTIEPAVISGAIEMVNKRSKRSLEDLFDAGILFEGFSPVSLTPFSLKASPVVVRVFEKPTAVQGWWLPAKTVQVTREAPLPPEIRAGEPVESTIVLSAQGTAAARLPVPVQPAKAGLKVYPGAETRETAVSPDGVVESRLKLSVALVAEKAGEIDIPAVTVPWFDTVTKRMRQAVLPAQTIRVLPAQPTLDTAKVSDDVSGMSVSKQAASALAPAALSAESPLVPQSVADTGRWGRLLGALMAGIMLGVLGTLLVFRRRLFPEKKGHFPPLKTVRKKKKPLPDLYPF